MAILIGAAICAGAACGGSQQQRDEYAEAGVVAGIAAVAQVVQTARAHSPAAQSNANAPGACCAICRACEFPCGDACVPYGTVCVDPPGCACTDSTADSRGQPIEPGPPSGCPDPLPGVVVHPR